MELLTNTQQMHPVLGVLDLHIPKSKPRNYDLPAIHWNSEMNCLVSTYIETDSVKKSIFPINSKLTHLAGFLNDLVQMEVHSILFRST